MAASYHSFSVLILILWLKCIVVVDCWQGTTDGRSNHGSVLGEMIARARETRVAIPLVGVYDTLSARIVASVQQQQPDNDVALFVSGFGVSAARLGQPDVGILTRNEMEDASRNIILSVPSSLPVIVDGDTGYGGASNVRETIRRAASIGAAAITIEVQVFPKRCTYIAGSGINVVDREESIRRVQTSLAAQKETWERDGKHIQIIARTDCRMGIDFQEAMERCLAFEELGVDIVYAENLQSNEEYLKLRDSISKPMVLAQVQTGSNDHSVRTLQEIGDMDFEMALFGVLGLQTALNAMSATLGDLLSERSSLPDSCKLASLDIIKNLVGFDDLDRFETDYPCT